jgi:glycine betaine/choline ABC-type transport system substrate-binding protein
VLPAEVRVHANICERATYMAALADGSIGAVPEYSGAILNYLDRTSPEKSSADVYAALEQQAASAGYVVGSYGSAEDVDTLTVTRATAEKYDLSSIEDLAGVAGDLTLGAPAPFQTAPYGTQGLKSVYGATFRRFVSLAPSGSIAQTALDNGTVDVADIFSTDPSLGAHDFVSLEDPENLFGAENVVPTSGATSSPSRCSRPRTSCRRRLRRRSCAAWSPPWWTARIRLTKRRSGSPVTSPITTAEVPNPCDRGRRVRRCNG